MKDNKLNKEDKNLLINITLSNRQFLINSKSLILAITIGLSGFLISLYALLINLKLIYPFLANILTLLLLIGIWTHWYIQQKKILTNIKKLNEQYQKYFFELYPQIREGEFYY